MEQLHNTPRDDEHEDEEYVAFPGGIPKKWLGPAMTLLCSVSVIYVPWAVWQTIRVGIAAGTPGVHIAKDVFHHLVFFAAAVSFLIVVCAKILERVMMYYLQAKKRVDEAKRHAAEAEQRAEETERRAAEAEQRAEETERRAAEAEQRAAEAERRAAEAEQRAEQEHQLRLQIELQRQTERQHAEEAENGEPHSRK